MLFKLTSKKHSGQVFLLSVLILSATLTAALFLVIIFTKDLRRSIETPESVRALYAADAAIEWQIYNSINPSKEIEDLKMENETEFEFKNDFPFSIKSVGYSRDRQISRGLEVYFGILRP